MPRVCAQATGHVYEIAGGDTDGQPGNDEGDTEHSVDEGDSEHSVVRPNFGDGDVYDLTVLPRGQGPVNGGAGSPGVAHQPQQNSAGQDDFTQI